MDFTDIYNTSNKVTSCGFLIKDTNTGKFLACHPTGNKNNLYDIPKGKMEANEDYLSCAIRELKEETGIALTGNEDIQDLGHFNYRPEKDLHLFKLELPIQLETLICTSMFTDSNGVSKPEMDGFELVDSADKYFYSLQPIIKRCLRSY